MARTSKPRRDRAAREHITALALKASRAMSHGFPVTVILRTRPEQKRQGRITHRELVRGFQRWDHDGASNIQIRIDGGEPISIERVADIRRQRVAPTT